MSMQAPGAWTLLFLTPPTPGQRLPLGPTTRIGRQAGNELVIKDAGVSRQHAVIERRPEGYLLRDLGSSNGTFVNDGRIQEPVWLQLGMRIRVGQTVLAVDEAAPFAPAPAAGAQAPPTMLAGAPPPGAAPVATSAGNRRRSCLRGCLVLAVIGVCLAVAVGALGYFLVTTGRFTPLQVQAQLSGATGIVEIINVDDVTLDATLVALPETEGSFADSRRLETLEQGGFGALAAGLYRLDFTGTLTRTCTLRVARGDTYRFSVTSAGIVVRRDGFAPQTAADLRVAESPLCIAR